MHYSYLTVLVPAVQIVAAATIPSQTIVQTECKSCPYTLCPNKNWNDENVTLSCWTEGTLIVDDTTWLKTGDNCYVTQWDLVEYPGDYTTDLPYCGYIRPNWTTVEARTKYYSDCFLSPELSEDDIKHYKYEIDLTLTCVARDRWEILGSKKWYKTTSNCYVHETTMYPVEAEDELDDCGPVPNLDPTAHDPDPVTSTAPTSEPTPPAFNTVLAGKPNPKLNRRFLYNTTIGEEYVNCTTEASVNPSRIKRVYEFGQEIIPQCATWGDSNNTVIFLFTTDFCYVKDWETDPGLLENTLRGQLFPSCLRFTDTE